MKDYFWASHLGVKLKHTCLGIGFLISGQGGQASRCVAETANEPSAMDLEVLDQCWASVLLEG